MDYDAFVANKRRAELATGHAPGHLNEHLFDFQHAIVSWATRRGRAAIFADTGLGKTLMQLSWADEVASHTGGSVLILAPLAVSEQTIQQGATFGIGVQRFDGQTEPGVYITNYERMDAAFEREWAGVVLDESSILKAHDGKTRGRLIDACQTIPYRLSCTATPSPNDFEELGNQCEFLGVMSRTEMLATYFVNDTGDTGTWRLKGWGASKFWQWMGTWSVVLRNPSDIGFDGSRYVLPPPIYTEHVVEGGSCGDLFSKPAMTLSERRAAQRASISQRCEALAQVVNADPSEPWLIWCHLNDEAAMLASLIPGAVNVQGSDKPERKVAAIEWFTGSSCQCSMFGDKLAAWTKHTSANTTKKTESFDLLNPALTEKRTEKNEENTTGFINTTTLDGRKSLLSEPQKSQSGLQKGESNTPQGQTCKRNAEVLQENGSKTTQLSDLVSESKNTGLQQTLTQPCLPAKMVSAQSANREKLEIKEAEDFTPTIATQQAMLEGFSAPHATWDLESSETNQRDWSGPRCICGKPQKRKVLISKSSMFGYGLNLQHCARMAFVGLNDSFEQFYQAVRRCHRFGQTRQVQVHIFTAENEGQILANIKRKELQHHEMSEQMIDHMKDIMNKELQGQENIVDEYREDVYESDRFTVHLGDCVKMARKLPDCSIDYSVFSPPFADLFVYSNSEHDMGNCKDDAEFVAQMRFLIAELYRVIKPGRSVSFHCMNLPTTKMRQGYIGLRDFRGDLIRAFQDVGFIYHAEVAIWKDPVVAMQRTKALGLLHKTIRENASMSRMGLPDYVVTMRKPGDAEPRVKHGDDLPVALWQKYASPIWDDINQGRTLNKLPARDENDEKHMCPLQLDVIERCIHLWTNKNDLVFSPFTGIGSEGYCAVKMGRRFIGAELKPSYWELAVQNIKDASVEQDGLFANL